MSDYEFYPLSLSGALAVRAWRSHVPQAFRTPYVITDAQQRRWFESLPDRPDMRFWEMHEGNQMLAVCGLTHIEWENGRAQISLVVGHPRKGHGTACMDFLLDVAIERLRLRSVYAECYDCNPNKGFWDAMAEKYKAKRADIPLTKYWNGVHYGSTIYTFQ